MLKRMKLAICNDTFRHHDFVGTGIEAACHGYAGLEIAPLTPGDVSFLTTSDAKRIGAFVRSHDLDPIGFHWLLAKTTGCHLTNPNREIEQRTFDYAAESMKQLKKALNPKY